jgi:hypothetical protein
MTDVEAVKQMMDQHEAILGARARTVLQQAGVTTIPLHIPLWNALSIMAPRGDELAQIILGVIVGFNPMPDRSYGENLFAARRRALVWMAAVKARPGCKHPSDWPVFAQTEAEVVSEAEALISQFETAQPMRVHAIERDLKAELRKRGWRV